MLAIGAILIGIALAIGNHIATSDDHTNADATFYVGSSPAQSASNLSDKPVPNPSDKPVPKLSKKEKTIERWISTQGVAAARQELIGDGFADVQMRRIEDWAVEAAYRYATPVDPDIVRIRVRDLAADLNTSFTNDLLAHRS